MTSCQEADFWFDPICPWTWLTARWLRWVAQDRGIAVHWHLMSLTLLNQLPQERDADLGPGDRKLQLVRVLAAAQHLHGPDALDPLYRAVGRRLHEAGRQVEVGQLDAVAEALAEAGLPAELLDYATSTSHDAAIRASHDKAVALSGPGVGSPVLAVAGGAFFGPVVSPTPTGPAAAELWDVIVALAAHPEFYELKRGRVEGPDYQMATRSAGSR
jgi:2-hydroxychromene-2-carboxylate isomerase